MNDARFTPTARYLIQIASKGQWKTVAYLNDLEEARSTMQNVPDLRVFDTWNNAQLRLQGLPRFDRKQDRRVEQVSRNLLTMRRRQRG